MSRRAQPLRIAIDTGGTFTDCIWVDPKTRRLRMLKVFSTPADPSEAIVDALKQITSANDLILLHGTTVGTNTLLQRRGARTALVTTKGFEDAIEIGRSGRAKLGGPSFCPVRRNETENEDLLARRTNPDPNLQRSSHPHRIQRHYSDPSGETFPPGRSWKRNHLALIFSRRVPLWPSLPSRGNVSASNCYNPVKIAPEAHELHTAH